MRMSPSKEPIATPENAARRQPGNRTACLVALFYLATSLYIAAHRLFWYDEIFTATISRLPNWPTIWDAMAHYADLQPPTYYMIVSIFDHLLGPGEIAARIPSALSLAVGLLIVFDCTRRMADGLHGLMAIALLGCSLLPYYGYEARPYGMYFMFAASSLWIWIHTPSRSKLSAVLFGGSVFCAVGSHYYAALCLVPYAAWEIATWRPWRTPSAKMIAGCVGVLCAGALFYRQILGARAASARFWAPASFSVLRGMLTEFFPSGLFILALIMVWIALTGSRKESSIPPMSAGERVGWLFLLIPISGYVAAVTITNGFYYRYFMGLLSGLAVGFSCLLWRHFRNSRRVSAGILLFLSFTAIWRQLVVAQHPDRIDPFGGQQSKTKRIVQIEEGIRNDGKQFFVMDPQQILGLEAHYYSKHPAQYLWLDDGGKLNATARNLMSLGRYSRLTFWNVEDLKEHARRAVLIDPSARALDAMKQAGFAIRIRHEKPFKIIYLE